MNLGYKKIADDNCERLMTNKDIRKMIVSNEKFDLVLAEQFITDCGLAIAYKFEAPVVGITANIMMPWTYARVGAPNHPAVVPNRLFATGTKLNFWQKIQSLIFQTGMNAYYRYVIQRSNQQIVNKVYPDVPDLENLGNNITLILLNQYFSMVGSRLHGANVVEISGIHVKKNDMDSKINDMDIVNFLDNAKNGIVYISFGSVAEQFPDEILQEIIEFARNNANLNFIWKAENISNVAIPSNLLIKSWLPQIAILSHPKVLAFVTHSGMMSTIEATHYGVPVIAVPLFGDQFFNAAAASEMGLGVVLDIYTLDRKVLSESLQTVLSVKYQSRAKELSKIWSDRPQSAMDTAVFWIEYVVKNHGKVNLKSPLVHSNIFEYLVVDIVIVYIIFFVVIIYCVIILLFIVYRIYTYFVTKTMKRKGE